MIATLTSSPETLIVETFPGPGDGCLGYLVVDEVSRTALAIDPRLDQVDQFLEALAARDVRLTYVLDTHTHADHLSGVRRLAQGTGATVFAHAASKLRGPAPADQGRRDFELGTRTSGRSSTPRATRRTRSRSSRMATCSREMRSSPAARGGRISWVEAPGICSKRSGLRRPARHTVVHPGHDYVGRAITTIGEEKAQPSPAGAGPHGLRLAALDEVSASGQHGGHRAPQPRGGRRATTLPPGPPAPPRSGAAPLLLDVRSQLEFESERIDGAVNLPLSARCTSGRDSRSAQAWSSCAGRVCGRPLPPKHSVGAGRRARVLEGGMNAWRRARLPCVKAASACPSIGRCS